MELDFIVGFASGFLGLFVGWAYTSIRELQYRADRAYEAIEELRKDRSE